MKKSFSILNYNLLVLSILLGNTMRITAELKGTAILEIKNNSLKHAIIYDHNGLQKIIPPFVTWSIYGYKWVKVHLPRLSTMISSFVLSHDYKKDFEVKGDRKGVTIQNTNHNRDRTEIYLLAIQENPQKVYVEKHYRLYDKDWHIKGDKHVYDYNNNLVSSDTVDFVKNKQTNVTLTITFDGDLVFKGLPKIKR